MKKKACILLAAALCSVACTQTLSPEIAQSEGETIRIIGTFAPTKTSITDQSNTLKSDWVEGDEIGIYCTKTDDNTQWNNQKGTALSEGETTIFNTYYALLYGYAIDYTSYAYYPYSTDAGTDYTAVAYTVPSSQTQSAADDPSHLSSTDLLYGSSTIKGQGASQNKDLQISFSHALSVLTISLASSESGVSVDEVYAYIDDEDELFSVSAGTIDLSTGVLTPTAGTNKISLSLSSAVTLSTAPSKFYLQITPGHAGKRLVVKASVNGIDTMLGSVKVPSTGIPAGVNALLSYDDVKDSGGDIVYTDLSATETANTYLITATGNYKFKATVKGNGTVPSALSSAVSSTTIEPKSVLVLWYNTAQTSDSWINASPIKTSSVKLQDGYVCFSTPSDFTSGNVVIAVFAEDGLTYDNITVDDSRQFTNATVLWSWDIWAAADYDPASSPIAVGDYSVMSRNLGALIDGASATGDYAPTGALGNFYQWGRKDPFPGFDSYTTYAPAEYGNKLLVTPTYTPIVALQLNSQGNSKNVDEQMFGYDHNTDGSVNTGSVLSIVKKSVFASSSDGLATYTDYATANPHLFISGVYENGSYTWYTLLGNSYKSLWGDPDSGTSRTKVKSLYDPCPAGWHVLDHEVLTSLATSTLTATDATISSSLHGFSYLGSYFPFAGTGRNENNFRISSVKASGYTTTAIYWSSSFQDGYEGYGYPGRLSFEAPANYTGSSSVSVKSAWGTGATGLNVRCVKD